MPRRQSAVPFRRRTIRIPTLEPQKIGDGGRPAGESERDETEPDTFVPHSSADGGDCAGIRGWRGLRTYGRPFSPVPVRDSEGSRRKNIVRDT